MSPTAITRPTESTRSLIELTIHPAIAGMPRLAQDDPRYLVMKATWAETGFIPPICVTEAGQIVDGRHRYWFARDMAMSTIPVVEVSSHEVASIVISGICGKNHTSKGQRAYLAVPYLQDAFQEVQARRLALLSSGGKQRLTAIQDADVLSERLGVSRELLNHARRLHAAFEKHPALRAEFEPRILAAEDPIGLGAALAGIAGKQSTENKPRGETRRTALHNWGVAWHNVCAAANRGWLRWTDEEKSEASETLAREITQLPDEALEKTAEAARAELKARKQKAAVEGN